VHSPALLCPFSRAEITVEASDSRKCLSVLLFLLPSELFAGEVYPDWESSQKQKKKKKNQKLIKTCFKSVYMYIEEACKNSEDILT